MDRAERPAEADRVGPRIDAVEVLGASRRAHVGHAGRRDHPARLLVAAEAEEAGLARAAVDRGHQRREARRVVAAPARPHVTGAVLVAEGADVDAVDHQQAAVVLFEEAAEPGQRGVADPARGGGDVAGEERGVDRVAVARAGRALRIAQRGRIPAAAGADRQEPRAAVGLRQRRQAARAGAGERVEGGDREAGKRGEAEELRRSMVLIPLS
ncbi:hypothetical protein OV079_19655 [Nannocystis pusilla]|uniref:Uncharacterized protein n=1 Tax=Nannocystis pusilla TaxID=889268 RepID=A0A9X3EP59_9BACT|nr:hypothetical protein [Nannocystis pusilla]MCY1007727.1 hypothetical protein [Nannocystis pusilla]